ncbi:MAG: hypothetical protein PHP96_03005 [Candidatus Dojkabacteria bacterium]|jgi:hypothetical protein|nr:hypothetical protein [Candidatus Dojkabacteria bacterium]MDD4561237.1 hypothetical protein [Candidatus Dojkabacteria bacterium]
MPKEISGIEEFGINQSENMDEFTKGEFGDLEMNDTGNEYCEETGEIDNNIQRSEEIVRESDRKGSRGNKVMRSLLIAAGLLSVRGSAANPHRDSSKDFSNERLPISSPLFGAGLIMSKEGEEYSMLGSDIGSRLTQNWFAKQESDVVQEIKKEEKVSAEVGKQESIEFLEFGSREEFESIIPSVEELVGYKFIFDRSHKKDGTPIRINSNMLYAISFERDISSGNQSKVFSLETEALKETMNNQRRVDWSFRYDELEGFAFNVDSFVTLVGPKGEVAEFGKVKNSEQGLLYILTKYTDSEQKEYSLASLDWEGYKTQSFGQEKNMTSFENFTTNFQTGLEDDRNSSFINKSLCEEDTGGKLFDLLHESPKLKELEGIAEFNKEIKVVLGVSNAINKYLEQLDDFEDINSGAFVAFVLGYIDSNGDSWYEEFFDMHMDWFRYTTHFENESELINGLQRVLEVGPTGRIGLNKNEVYRFYSKLIGLMSPQIDSAGMNEIEGIMGQKDFERSPVSISLKDGNIAYFYQGESFSMEKVVPGDILFPGGLVFKVYHSREKDGSFNLWTLDVVKGEKVDSIRLDSINSRKSIYLTDTLEGKFLLRDSSWQEILK